jgi:protoheme IX farnesyltransferase
VARYVGVALRVEPLTEPLESSKSPLAIAGDFLALTKPRLSGLVLFTAAPGMWLSTHSLDWKTVLFAMVGTAGTVGAANTINCVIERDSDRFMARTAKRPLPMQRLSVVQALLFSAVLACVSLPMLWLGVNPMTGALGLIALLTYAFVYTPMKSRTHWAMQVGAIPGALPPLMGWTAATGRIEAPGLALFAILFFWQLPHFIAIALFRKDEYRAAGLTSLPLEKGDDVARSHAVGYVVALLGVSTIPFFLHVAGWLYLGAALALGAWFAAVAVRGWRQQGGADWARKLFKTSLIYLTGLFAALAVPFI